MNPKLKTIKSTWLEESMLGKFYSWLLERKTKKENLCAVCGKNKTEAVVNNQKLCLACVTKT